MTDFDHRTSTDNWARIEYDKTIWFPIPSAFKGTAWADAAEWAYDWAGNRFLLGGREVNRKVMKKEVLPFAEALVRGRNVVVGKAAAHKFYFHCPDYTKTPVGVFVALWKCQGTREEAFDFYSHWGDAGATGEPVTEWFETEALGRGVKAQWSGLSEAGRYERVNYIFRNEEFDTDVLVWTMDWDHDRFLEVAADLDTFVYGIRCIPDPVKAKAAQEGAGS